jgi:hypothetical protein
MRMETVKTLAAITVPLAFLAIIWPAPSGQGMVRGKPVPILPGLRGHMNDAASLTIKTGSATIHLTRKPVPKNPSEGWQLADKSDYPVSPATIRPVLDGMLALRGVERKTDRPALYGRLDLDLLKDGTARELILANAQDKTLGDVILGRQKDDASGQGHDLIYVRVPSAPRAWLAEPPISPPAEALDYIDHAVVSLDADKVATITLTQGSDTTIIARPKPGGALTVMDLPKGAKLKNAAAPNDIAGALHALELVDVQPAAKLTGAPAAQAKYETFDGLTVTAALTKRGGAPWITVTAAGTGKAAKDADAINARTKGWAYQIADAQASQLETKRTDLIVPPPAPPAVPAPAKPAPASSPAPSPAPAPASPPPPDAPKPAAPAAAPAPAPAPK